MQSRELIKAFEQAGRRIEIVGTPDNGALVALDVEGRIFAFMDGVVLNRVNEAAIAGISTHDGYINPGGDGFWPAPEGSSMGYEYATGAWRVPSGLTNARYQVKAQTACTALVSAEVDLINAAGLGMPFIFSRDIAVSCRQGTLAVTIAEGIEYIGTKELDRTQAIIAPWSLCQFDCGAECTLRLPDVQSSEIWDLYADDSSCHRHNDGKAWNVDMVTDFRFQLGLSPKINWLEFEDRGRGFAVHRSAARLADGLDYIDIGDRDFTAPCNGAPCRFSAYCDPSGFMEIEAAGGAPATLAKGAKTVLVVTTQYRKI